MVKGHLECSDDTARSSADGYYKRLWIDGCNGAPIYEYETGFEESWERKSMRFFAAMDHSGGSTGSVLQRYGQSFDDEDDKMDKVHEFRLRMLKCPAFNNKYISACILFMDSVKRGIVNHLNGMGIDSYLKIDSGMNDDGMLKDFPIQPMIDMARKYRMKGTKMRSFIDNAAIIPKVVDQQFELAATISSHGLLPIIEPEVDINAPSKNAYELILKNHLQSALDKYEGKCILKLTLPEENDLYHDLNEYDSVEKIVGLSGGYSTEEACDRLSLQKDMTASFSRALTEGLQYKMTDKEFNLKLSENIHSIYYSSKAY